MMSQPPGGQRRLGGAHAFQQASHRAPARDHPADTEAKPRYVHHHAGATTRRLPHQNAMGSFGTIRPG